MIRRYPVDDSGNLPSVRWGGVVSPEVRFPFDAVHDRVPHYDIGGGHVDFGPENMFSVGKFVGPHPGKKVKILLVNSSEIL